MCTLHLVPCAYGKNVKIYKCASGVPVADACVPRRRSRGPLRGSSQGAGWARQCAYAVGACWRPATAIVRKETRCSIPLARELTSPRGGSSVCLPLTPPPPPLPSPPRQPHLQMQLETHMLTTQLPTQRNLQIQLPLHGQLQMQLPLRVYFSPAFAMLRPCV